MTWLWLVFYLVVSVAGFRFLLRMWFDEFGPSWEGAFWAACAFIPLAGPITVLVMWAVNLDLEPDGHPQVPVWLRRIGGAE